MRNSWEIDSCSASFVRWISGMSVKSASMLSNVVKLRHAVMEVSVALSPSARLNSTDSPASSFDDSGTMS